MEPIFPHCETPSFMKWNLLGTNMGLHPENGFSIIFFYPKTSLKRLLVMALFIIQFPITFYRHNLNSNKEFTFDWRIIHIIPFLSLINYLSSFIVSWLLNICLGRGEGDLFEKNYFWMEIEYLCKKGTFTNDVTHFFSIFHALL